MGKKRKEMEAGGQRGKKPGRLGKKAHRRLGVYVVWRIQIGEIQYVAKLIGQADGYRARIVNGNQDVCSENFSKKSWATAYLLDQLQFLSDGIVWDKAEKKASRKQRPL